MKTTRDTEDLLNMFKRYSTEQMFSVSDVKQLLNKQKIKTGKAMKFLCDKEHKNNIEQLQKELLNMNNRKSLYKRDEDIINIFNNFKES